MDKKNIYMCNKHKEELMLVGKKLICAQCNKELGYIDNNGIIKFTDSNFYYREMPKKTLMEILDDENIFQGMFNKLNKNIGLEDAISYAISYSRGTGLFNLNFNSESRILDYGSGWGTLCRIISPFVNSVIALDLTYESLVFSKRISQDNITHVHSGDKLILPFKDNIFDIIFLNGALEWVPESFRENNPKDVQKIFLKELKRILKPEGQILIGIENRISILYFAGIKEEHAGIRYLSLMPRPLADIVSNKKRGIPYRNYTYSVFGQKKIFREVGLINTKVYWPWWIYRKPIGILPLKGKNYRSNSFNITGNKVKNTVGKIVYNLFTGIPKLRVFVPSYYYIIGSKNNKLGFVDELLCEANNKQINNEGLFTTGSKCIVAFGGDRVIKFGLNEKSMNLIDREIINLNRLRQYGKIREYLPNYSVIMRGKMKIISTERYYKKALRENKYIDSLDNILTIMRSDDIVKTNFNLELIEKRSVNMFIDSIGVECEWKYLIDFLGANEIFCCPVHGDFHEGQIFSDKKGLKVIDWDSYDEYGVLGSDEWCYLFNYYQKQKIMNYAESINRVLIGEAISRNKIEEYFVSRQKNIPIQNKIAYFIKMICRSLDMVDHFVFLGGGHINNLKFLIKTLQKYLKAGELHDDYK